MFIQKIMKHNVATKINSIHDIIHQKKTALVRGPMYFAQCISHSVLLAVEHSVANLTLCKSLLKD